MRDEKKKLIIPYLLPAVALYLVFFIGPAIYGLWISFHEWNGFTEKMSFVGIKNYLKILEDPIYWQSFLNMMLILFVGGIFVFFIGFIFTALMSQGVTAKKAIRAIIFFPQIIAPIALAVVWNYLYRFDIGFFNSILNALGLNPVNWTGPDNIMMSAVISIVWYSTGFYAIILLAGVDKIPNTIFEAARVEGASTIKIFTKITIPLIWDVISIAVILWGINAIRLFDFLFAFGGPEPPTRIWNTAMYQFILGFGQRTPIYQLGYSSAIAITMIIVVLLFVVTGRKLFKREVYEL
ncbi:ABC-type sugar transport system permease subunit [Bacillus pakistanensis]|uniref:ABC-type sugar transport system permease subunit n=1 Tax=Rossellomorea pakistanensis TaxID=992288 RepID=A0ABS2NJ82_9BACI|nr:sugar ABC transporter permease [Bacillus pakistanensis]MBM7587911.1 ABC-type sugar transport system permease subunit [Bacillus pakistanensis]